MIRNKFFSVLLKLSVILLIIAAVIVAVILIRNHENHVNQNGKGAVVSNGHECSGIGRKILENGGSAVDAAISAIICEGITCPQSAGLGGGFFATIYIKSKEEMVTLNAREVAPIKATKDMFVNNSEASVSGGLSIAVPGEVLGLWEMHKKYGVLEWSELIQPNIDLCRNGHKVTAYLSDILEESEDIIMSEPTLKDVFVNPITNKPWKKGDLLKRLKLADSLEAIAKEGADAIYSKNGSLLKSLVDDIQSVDGIIIEEDFLNYKVHWDKPHEIDLDNNLKLYTFPLPGSGAVLTFILNILRNYELKDDSLSYHRIVEAFKFGYAKRTQLGSEISDTIRELVKNLTSSSYADEIAKSINDERTSNDFRDYGVNLTIPEDHGTAHLSVLAPNGDAVSITSTINYLFGSLLRSPSTGIILNNEMDDFSTPDFSNIYEIPPSPANFIKPGKHPMSSMVPSIVLDQYGNVRLIIGGSGGTYITSGVAFTIIEHLFKGVNLTEAMAHPRLHHQLLPMTLQYEKGFDMNIINDLKTKFNHKVLEKPYDSGFSALTGIASNNGQIESVYDPRRLGSSEIF